MKYMTMVGVLLLFTTHASAQHTYSGKVFDTETREPLAGVNITVPGTTTGTVTDLTGTFQLNTEKSADSLRASFVGYATQTVKTNIGSGIRIGLDPFVQNLQAVTVTASRDQQQRKDIPATVNQLPAQVINETNATQFAQLLNKVPGLVMQDLNNEQHAMSIRQPMSKRPYFLYLEDGLPIAPVGNFNHNQLIEVNMLGIRNVEVIKGPASSIYGSNAVGGAVNFITQSPTAVPTATIGSQMNNSGYRRVEFYAGNYITPKFGLSIGGYMANQRDSWQAYSDLDKRSISAKAIYHFNQHNHLTGYVTSNNLDTQTGGSIDSVGFYSRQYLSNNAFSYRKVNATRGRITLNHEWAGKATTDVSAYYGQNAIGQLPRYRIRNVNKYAAKGEENENSYHNYGLVAQHTQPVSWLASKLITGVAANIAPNDYWATYLDIGRDTTTGYYTGFTPHPDSLLADYRTNLLGIGAYAQFEANPTEKLKVVVGLRYDQLSYGYNNHLSAQAYSGVPDTSITNATVSPRLGLTYSLGDQSGVYANYSHGFAPPQASDLFNGTKVPTLKPASFNSYEAGGWTALMKDKLYLDVCIYRMEGTNEIISFRLPDNSTENRNSGKTLHQGMEYSVTWKPATDVFLRIGGSQAVHKYVRYVVQETAGGEVVSYDGKYMPEAPGFIANAEITCKPKAVKGLRLSLEWQGIGPWYKNDDNTSRYEDKTLLIRGVSLLNLRAGYAFKGLEVYGNILNLTDELFATSVTRSNNKDSFAAGAPRLVVLGFKYTITDEKE
ncbi:MAG: TonB-dependent receptor [Flavobacteriales bacterium]|nr:TonB-dependent receptor [Flavobacteriales bacterium]MCB9446860.1 TonB-dependent receptor [Flavobacteriales bacterium]